jgi:hypothetical protein
METCRGPRLRGHSTCPLEEGTRRLACPRYDARGAVSLLCSTPADAATHDHPGGACGRFTVSLLQSKSHGADRGAVSAGTGSDTVWSGSSSKSLFGPQWMGQACDGSGHTALLRCCCGCRGHVACRVTSRAGVWVCGCVGAWVDAMRSTDFACVGPCRVEWMQGRTGRSRGGGWMDTWVRYMGHARL